VRLACISTILGYPWGSPDRLWTDLAQRCLERGDAVFLGLSPLTADSAAVRQLQTAGAELFLRPRNSVYLGWRDRLSRQMPWRDDYLERQLTRFAPDVVVLTQGATFDSLAEHYLVSWLRDTRTPYVVLCHNNADGPALPAADSRVVVNFLDAAARVLFSSTHNRASAERQLGHTLTNAGLLQNPLPPGEPIAWPAQSERPVIGLLGRLDIHHKGLDFLAQALARLPAPRPRVVLTGRNEDPATLAKILDDSRVTADVEIRAPVSADQVGRAHGELELFVLSSRYEGCASSMLEAMRAGRPVLATPVGGVSDWIVDGVNGYVAAAANADALHDTLVRALAERDRWPALGAAARRAFIAGRDSDPVGTLLAQVDQAVLQPA
jgi:glycosyltransferase involved in cell wall biosynthesis